MALVEKSIANVGLTEEGSSSTSKATQPNSENPLVSLMSKLRSKAMHYKTWTDLTKALRVTSMDKRHVMDSSEKNQLQRCLDVIQKSIKVTSLQSMVERLESITRQQGLKFTAGPTGMDCFISSDMFYVEVLLETTGEVKDVKIAHHGDPVSCPELTKVLSDADFAVFNSHLEGLSEIYQLNADKKQKTKAFLALQALETDLSTLAQFQCSINDPNNVVHKSPVGILQPRRGGHPMKLTYFISPYDLLDVENKSSINLSVDAVLERGLGHSVTVCIESSTAHKLQTTSLMLVKTQDGKNLPTFAAHTNLNSTTLPASFVLHLKQPIPMATSLVKLIKGVTNLEFADLSTSQSLLSLISQQTSKGQLECSQDRGLCVTLPDQHHCYYFSSELQGVMVSSIPFTHPTAVPQILVFLRQQTLFNTLIASCVRPSSKQDVDCAVKFEVATLSTYHIIVSFEHPLEESLATVDLDLKDITNVKCKIYTLGSDSAMCTDEYASKVMQRCLSIPVTMRAVIRKAQGQQQQLRVQGDVFYTPVNSRGIHYLSQLPGYGGNGDGSSTGGSGFSSDFLPISHTGGTTEGSGQSDVYSLQSYTNMPEDNYSSSQGESYSTEHAAGPTPLSGKPAANTMLMSMLSDIPSANTGGPFPFLPQGNGGKRSKLRKRKNTSDSFPSISPKRKAGDADLLDASSSASFDSAINSTYSEQAGRAHISYEPAYAKSENSNNPLENLHFLRSPRSSNKTPTEPFLGSEGSSSDMTPESLTPKSSSYSYGPSPYEYPGEAHQESGKSQDPPALSSESLFEEESNCASDLAETKHNRKNRKIKTEDQKMQSEDSSDDMKGDDFKADDDEDDDDDDDDDRSSVSASMTEVDESKMLTSIKIAKMSDSLKISKTESKNKQKESRKTSSGDSPTRKKDGRKERKRRRMEASDSEKLKPLHINLSHDSSLMPPPDSSKATEGHVVRLNMKPLTSTSTSSTSSTSSATSANAAFSPKSTNVLSKKLGSSSPNSSKSSSSLKVSTGEKQSKVSQVSGNKYTEGENNPSPKVSSSSKPPKHRSSKSSMSPSSSGGSSPNKGMSSPKQTTLKLKNLNLPASTTITPVNPKTSPLSSTSVCSASISIIPTANDTASGCVGAGANATAAAAAAAAASKAAARSRKNSLNAVIDKLRVHAGAQQTGENTKGDSDRRESKQGMSNPKTSDNTKSSKYSSSDQFTIKQSSGIKLTVTKTRTTETGRVTSKVKVHSSGKVNTSQTHKHPSSPASKNVLSSKKSSQSSSNPSKPSSGLKPKVSTSSVSKVGSPPVSSKTFKSPPGKTSSHKSSSISDKNKISEPKPSPDRDSRIPSTPSILVVSQTKDLSSPLRSNGSSVKRETEPLLRMVPEAEDFCMVVPNPITTSKEEESPRVLNRTPSVEVPLEEMDLQVVDGKTSWIPEELPKEPPELKKPEICELEEKLTPPPLLATQKQPPPPQLLPSRSQLEHESSSPEDGLVIDYPSTGTPSKGPKSPDRVKDRSWIPTNSRVTDKGITEKTPSPSVPPPSKSPFQISPSLKSPAPVGTPPSNHSVSSSMSRPSPCIIDDDLMDEAVMSLGD